MRLDGKTVVVTGASIGLGRAMADAFVGEGASVVYSARTAERLDAAVEAVRGGDPPGQATAIPADVRSWEDVQRLIAGAEERFGAIDLLVNNAGLNQRKVNPDHAWRPVQDIPIASWDAIQETNVRGVFLCSKAVLPGMLSRDAGRIIHIVAGHGTSGRANRSAYVTSKFGLEGFHESLALELADTGVDSVALRPPSGGVFTESAGEIGESPDDYANESPAVIAEPAVQIAGGSGENGGRYKATPDGTGFVEDRRCG